MAETATGARPSDLLERATAGLRSGETWKAAGFVAVSMVTTLLLFAAALVLLVPALALCVIGIGFPATVLALDALFGLAGFERRRAGWVGIDVAPAERATGSWMTRFRDRVRWRAAGFALVAWFPVMLGFAAVAAVWGLALYLLSIPIWGWAIDSFSVTEILGQAIAGGGVLLIAPWPTRGIARLLARHTENRLGPDPMVAMQRQVDEVTASRAEILDAVAGERRRIERNLHDGVQQQLVALGIDLGLAESRMATDPEGARALLAEATRKTRASISELRTIGRGLHPAILGDRGLDAALSAAVANATIPVELRSALDHEPPEPIAEAAYFVVSEALTNVMKHSEATLAVVDVATGDRELLISVYDDGHGGATQSGTGIAGIAARAQGLGGGFDLMSPRGGPTTLSVSLPYP